MYPSETRFIDYKNHLIHHGKLTIQMSCQQPLEVIGNLKETEQVKRLIIRTIDTYRRLDILVNNAGLFQPVTIDQPHAYETFVDLMQINLNAVVLLTTLAVPHLKKTKGCIVNISSNLHQKCMDGGFAYSTAKAALTMFTKTIAVDLAPEVRVNSVSPGPIATLMPTRCGMEVDTYRKLVGNDCLVGRVGEPDEVARVVLFLASPEAAFITGTDLIIDGGSTIKPAGRLMSQPSE